MSVFEGFVPVEGGRLWAQAAGQGTGVVLAHAGIADSRMWDPQWAALAARHRVVRYDLRGFVAHLPNLERPEWFTETLLGFLAEIG